MNGHMYICVREDFCFSYSFANTPLNAAHAPLAAAMGIHGVLPPLLSVGTRDLRAVGAGEVSGDEFRS